MRLIYYSRTCPRECTLEQYISKSGSLSRKQRNRCAISDDREYFAASKVNRSKVGVEVSRCCNCLIGRDNNARSTQRYSSLVLLLRAPQRNSTNGWRARSEKRKRDRAYQFYYNFPFPPYLRLARSQSTDSFQEESAYAPHVYGRVSRQSAEIDHLSSATSRDAVAYRLLRATRRARVIHCYE